MWESASPDSVRFPCFRGVFETVEAEGTSPAQFLSKEDGLLALSAVGDIFGEEQDGSQRAWCGR